MKHWFSRDKGNDAQIIDCALHIPGKVVGLAHVGESEHEGDVMNGNRQCKIGTSGIAIHLEINLVKLGLSAREWNISSQK